MRDLLLLIAAPFLFLGGLVLLFYAYGWLRDFTKWWRGRYARGWALLRAEVVRARTLAAPVYTASAVVLTPEERADLELEGTRQIEIDDLGSWVRPEELDEDAPLFERVRRARPFDLETAIGPGWVLVTKPENAEVVGAE